jgi:hypothetical protein
MTPTTRPLATMTANRANGVGAVGVAADGVGAMGTATVTLRTKLRGATRVPN